MVIRPATFPLFLDPPLWQLYPIDKLYLHSMVTCTFKLLFKLLSSTEFLNHSLEPQRVVCIVFPNAIFRSANTQHDFIQLLYCFEVLNPLKILITTLTPCYFRVMLKTTVALDCGIVYLEMFCSTWLLNTLRKFVLVLSFVSHLCRLSVCISLQATSII